jgi:LacI family transcriptional regulator
MTGKRSKYNSQMTIRDIALKAGVSLSSAGDILAGRTGPKASYNPATRERVLQAARDLNYVPNLAAQRLRRGRSGYIGLILTYKLIDRSFGLMLQILEEEVHKGHRRLLLSIVSNKDEEQEQARVMLAEQVEGLLFGPVYRDISDRAEWCRSLTMPIVFFGEPEKSGFDEVGVSFSKAADLSVRHLYEMGHRRVGLLRATESVISSVCSAGIFAGDQWMSDEEVPVNDLSQLVDPVVAFADQWKSSSLRDRPTAVICHDDYMASFALNVFREKGINVPNDLSVVGLANLPESQYYSPSLTTIDVKLIERMQSSVSILFDRLDGKLGEPIRKMFEPELVVRNSVKHIR